MTGLVIFTVVAVAGCKFLIYFMFALWRDSRKPRHGQRVEIRRLPRLRKDKAQFASSLQRRRHSCTCAEESLSGTQFARTKSWRTAMQDLIWVVVTIAFFAMAIGYVKFCDRVK